MSSKKYLVTGCPDGDLGFIFDKFLELNDKNGPFSAAFIMGGVPTKETDLTALFDLIKTDYSSKFPIYFVASKVKVGLLEDSLIEELAQRNVHFMRPFGVSKTPEGLRFAYISGTEDDRKSSDEIRLIQEDLKYVEEQYMKSSERDEDEGLIDILFSWSWPHEIKNSTHLNAPESYILGPLMWNLKPRYIFSPSHDAFEHFERAPYENVDMKSGEFFHPTRFIALTSAENAKEVKKKWIYALNLVPGKFVTPLSLTKRPDDCTSNPFLPVASSKSKITESQVTSTAPNYFFQVSDELGSKRKYEGSDPTQLKRPPPDYVCKKCHGTDHFYRDCIYKDSKLESKSTYVCHICHEPGHHIRNCPKKDEASSVKNGKAKLISPETCWFCLSNPAARKHLIIDIGDEVYLSLAKGPLTPEHLIIVPIEHVSSTTSELSMQKELEQFMKKINSLHEGKRGIFFRVASNPSHHYHIQSILIDSNRNSDFLEFLEDFSIKLGYNFKQINDDKNIENSAFFEFSYIENDGSIVRLAHTFDPAAFFPAQYGRQVMASFLEIEGGADWKNQLYTEDDEKKFVSAFKSKLKQ